MQKVQKSLQIVENIDKRTKPLIYISTKQLKLYNFHFQLNLDAKLNHARLQIDQPNLHFQLIVNNPSLSHRIPTSINQMQTTS